WACAGYFKPLFKSPTGSQSHKVVFLISAILRIVLNQLRARQAFCIIHNGVEFTVSAVAPGIWKWQFRIGDKVISGKTEAKLDLLAIRRGQLRIGRGVKKGGPKKTAL